MKKLFILFLIPCYFALASGVVQNNPMTTGYNYFFNGESLRQVLIKFAKNNGVKIVFASDISKTKLDNLVSGRFTVNKAEDLLDNLATQYGFAWFSYSGTIYVTSLRQKTKTFSVAADEISLIRNNLSQVGLIMPKFGFSELGRDNKIVITGSDAYINLVSTQIDKLNVAPNSQQFAIFHLKYANATDTQLSYNGQQITIPGVATILKQILSSRNNGNVGKPLATKVVTPVTDSPVGVNEDESSVDSLNSSAATLRGAPIIQADNRLNTIIIRDRALNLQLYRNLIKQLDVPAPLIQIEVLIIRLDQDKLNQQGVNWWINSKNGFGAQFGAGGQTAAANSLVSSFNEINPGQLMIGDLAGFTDSLLFLQNKNLAQVTSKPSLVTIDNIPAIISATQNLFVAPSNSTNSANPDNMNQVQLIQSLQITPHIVYTDDNQIQIKLGINLQDGAIDQSKDNMTPGTIQSTLTSQAVIPDGKSLVLAGYTKDTTAQVSHKIPILGDIPILGWFFKNSSEEKHKITTIYVVTPKIVAEENLHKLTDYVELDGSKVNLPSENIVSSSNESSLKSFMLAK